MAYLLHIYSRCVREDHDGEKENQDWKIERQDVGKRDEVFWEIETEHVKRRGKISKEEPACG